MNDTSQGQLFQWPVELPEGFVYQPDFISVDAERCLLQEISRLPLQEASYRQWTAKRRIVSYGGQYDFSSNQLNSAAPVPDFLHGLRDEIARWTGLPAFEFSHAIIAEYRPGTQLGWHRDVADFDVVVGISLAGIARMRFRPYPPSGKQARATATVEVEPRSAYMLKGVARWEWQHAISPTKQLRYSITFRTLSGRR